MRAIPQKLKAEIDTEPFYKRCVLTGRKQVVIHHAFIYSGKQINELWAFAPLAPDLHTGGAASAHRSQLTRELVQLLCLQRASAQDLAKYPRTDWRQLKTYLAGRADIYAAWAETNNFDYASRKIEEVKRQNNVGAQSL
jgi:hypothetical protein